MKEIQVRCYEPIAVDPTYEQGWSDVWLRWKWNPKRACRGMLTLIGRIELLSDMETNRECIKHHPKLSSVFRKELEAQEGVYDSLKKDFIVYTPKTACVYTKHDWITRKIAEDMMALYLSTQGVSHAKFVWKRPKTIISPMTILPKGMTDGDSVAPISRAGSDCP